MWPDPGRNVLLTVTDGNPHSEDADHHQWVTAAIKIQYLFRRWKKHKQVSGAKAQLQKMNTCELRKKLEDRESSVMVARKRLGASTEMYWT